MATKGVQFLVFIVPVSMVLLVVVGGPDPAVADIIQDLRNGVRMAGKFLGIDTISDVADLVAKGFSRQGYFLKPEANTPMQQQAASMMVMIWRLIGLDGSKLGALVMNAMIFVAHVIATNLGTLKKPGINQPTSDDSALPLESSILQSESPLDWLLNNPPKQFRSMLETIQDGNLTDYLESDLGNLEQASPEDAGCIKLLICKIKPFIWKMQDVVRDRLAVSKDGSDPVVEDTENIAEIIYRSVPKLTDFQANGARCEARFKHCVRNFG